jgi:uncharacterized protein (DUF302 family)
MLYIKETQKSVDQAFNDLEASIKHHGFGLLHHYDFKQTLKEKGFELPNECRVLEVCNPKQACEVLHMDMAINMALPCRISIYEEAGKTFIGMIPPSTLLGLISNTSALQELAHDVERTTRQIIDNAA